MRNAPAQDEGLFLVPKVIGVSDTMTTAFHDKTLAELELDRWPPARPPAPN